VWNSQEEAKFADELKEQTGENGWRVIFKSLFVLSKDPNFFFPLQQDCKRTRLTMTKSTHFPSRSTANAAIVQ